MDAAEAREERLKAKAARDEAKAKYDATAIASPEHKEFEKDWLRAEVAFAQANFNLIIAQGTTSGVAFDAAKSALDFARDQLDKATSAAAAPSRKRPLGGPDEGVMRFLDKQYKLEMTENRLNNLFALSASDEPRVWKLAERLYGLADPDAPECIFVRECYQPMATQMMEFLYQGRDVLMAGTRGVSKSVFGTLVALLLALEGKRIIVYRHKKREMLLVSNALREDARVELERLLTVHGLDMLSPGVWDAQEPKKFLSSVISSHHTIVVHDVGEYHGVEIDPGGANATLIVSSPNADRLKFLQQRPGTKRFYMPPWTEGEINITRETCYPSLDPGLVAKRCMIVPGVARWILATASVDVEKAQVTQIGNVTLEYLRRFFLASSFEYLPSQHGVGGGADNGTELVFQVVPTADWRDYHVDFLTPRVAVLLAERYVQYEEANVKQFAQSVSSIPALASFRGRVLEARAHKELLVGVQRVPLRALIDGDAAPRIIDIPPLNEAVARYLEDLIELHPLQYFRPSSATFKSVDGFAILEESLFNPKAPAGVFALVAFQMTVSPKHPVIGSGLERVLKDVQSKARLPQIAAKTRGGRVQEHPPLKLYLVFVTQSNVLCKVQNIKKDDGENFANPLSVAPQFALSLGPGLDEFFKLTRPWE